MFTAHEHTSVTNEQTKIINIKIMKYEVFLLLLNRSICKFDRFFLSLTTYKSAYNTDDCGRCTSSQEADSSPRHPDNSRKPIHILQLIFDYIHFTILL